MISCQLLAFVLLYVYVGYIDTLARVKCWNIVLQLVSAPYRAPFKDTCLAARERICRYLLHLSLQSVCS